jgi:hypothetical protein
MSLDVKILRRITISNPLEMNDKSNEDALNVVETGNIKRFVVCDGAGGAGVFCGDWARTVAESLPEDPGYFKSHFENWYQSIGESFHDYITCNKDLSDPVLLYKFYQKGSLTTLLSLWIDIQNGTYTCAGIGDSLLFHFHNGSNWELKSVFPVNDMKSIHSHPKLLRWNEETIALPEFDEQPICENSMLVLCSDSMARYILIMLDLINPDMLVQAGVNRSFQESLSSESIKARKEIAYTNLQIRNVNELLIHLITITQTEVEFRNEVVNMINSGSLEEDDLTISIVEVNVRQRT